jgi:hypothetical protein
MHGAGLNFSARAHRPRRPPDLVQLEAERDDLQHQIAIILKSFRVAALAAQQPELERLGDRVNALATRIRAAGTRDAPDLRPVEKVVDGAMHIIGEKREALRAFPAQPLRDLVDRLVIDAVVDMATKAVELTVVLPTWAPQAPRKFFKNDLFTSSGGGPPV